jgi:hypothetical protein
MRRIMHLSVNIDGLLKQRRKLNGFFDDENGMPMTDKEIRDECNRLKLLGHKLIGSDKCEGFDPFGGGCPGHEINE